MFLYYRLKTKDVVMRSESQLEAPALIEIEVTPTVEQMAKFEDNHEAYIRNGRLEFETPERVKEDQRKQRIEKARNDLRTADSITELKNIILEIIKE